MLSCGNNIIATSKRVGMKFCYILLLIYFFRSQASESISWIFQIGANQFHQFSVMHKNQNQSKVVKTRELALSLLQQLGETREISHLPKWNQTKILHRIYYLLFSSNIRLRGSVRILTRFSSIYNLMSSSKIQSQFILKLCVKGCFEHGEITLLNC